MTEEERQARLAALKNSPRQIQTTVLIAFALGIVTFFRVVARAYTMDLSMAKGMFHGLVLAFWFLIAGGSLYARSRWGFVGLIALSLFPMLGLLALSVHLLRLTLEGTLTASWPDTIHCFVALLQFITTCVLFRYLLARQVRQYVWKSES